MGTIIAAFTACFAATLTGSEVTAFPGQTAIPLPLSFQSAPPEEVSAIQFDILFDPAALSLPDVVVGPAAEDAHKGLYLYVLEPGATRVVIAGVPIRIPEVMNGF